MFKHIFAAVGKDEFDIIISKVFYFIKLRQLHVNFLQWLIKYMNICGGSRIIAENNEIH